MKPRESVAENKFCAWVKRVGGKTRKMNGIGHRDWPDRLVIKPGTPMFFVEFKRENEKPRPSQQYLFDWIAQATGRPVFVCDSYEQALIIYRDWQPDVHAAPVPAGGHHPSRAPAVRRPADGPRPR